MVILGAPLFLAATNPTPHLELLECVGIGIWLLAWAWENTADLQKQAFLTQCKRDSKAQPDQKESIKLAVLGMKPYDGYKLWTLCRQCDPLPLQCLHQTPCCASCMSHTHCNTCISLRSPLSLSLQTQQYPNYLRSAVLTTLGSGCAGSAL